MEATPDSVIGELRRIQSELEKGPNALYEAEVKLAELDAELDITEAKALLNAEGTVGERQAHAKLAAAGVKLSRDIARAEVNRVKMKIKTLESAAMATAVIAKQVELMWRSS